MMIVTKDEFETRKDEIKENIKKGAVFVHPTDTIYGIGCNATDSAAVKRIRAAKARYKRPFSVIAPSKEWIKDNCEMNKEAEKWVGMLPGPFTFIMKLKNNESIAKETNMGMETVGVRIPKHWFSDVAKELNIPIVTTSANVMGREFMTTVDDLDPQIKMKMNFMVYEGEKQGRPSKIVDLTGKNVEVKER